ncbi:Ig-like domain-containing protein [Undibacterium sp. CY18W]|uniref:Ig-like domain-containing protein n=1 Tax=Undibacterium hunanense TaxID=2762292 RepID=A0ABR6ZZD2_9BURK|nr:Ig-like domain-containing protein [Undibacterium hunanense]MBC3921114.1 Ig-like domain-containing protein [Undibacterium hunanense]
MNILQRYLRPLACVSAILITSLVAGCGGGGGDPILGLPSATLSTLTVSPLTATVASGGMQQFVATATYADGASRDVTATSAWTSATPAVATVVSNTGVAKGVVSGSSVISASFGGKTASATLTVSPALLQSISLLPANPSIAVGGTQKFQAMGTYSDGTTSDITAISTFTSASPAFATVSSTGLATGVAIGSSTITAVSGVTTATTKLTVTGAGLASIALTPANPPMQIGTTQQLTVTAKYTDGSSVNVTASSSFSSATPAIATVSTATASNGLVTAIGSGTSTITATFNGSSATATVNVSSALLTSITVTPVNTNLAVGSTQQYLASGNYSDGTTANISNGVTWTTSSPLIATVLPNGLANAISTGNALVTASLVGKIASASLVVIPAVTLNSIAITPSTANLAVGSTQAFIATGTYSDGSNVNITNSVTWSSGTTPIATILSSGVATGISAGTTIITASSAGKSASSTLTVLSGTALTSITVTPANNNLTVGATQSLVATGNYSDGSTAVITNSVTWTSGASPVATVSANGLVSAVAAGSTPVVAISGSKSGSATINVLPVAALNSIAVTPGNPTIGIGGTQNFVATGSFADGSSLNISNAVTWASANSAIASVSVNGVANGLSGGTTSIAANLSGKTGSTGFTVTPVVTLSSISLTPANASATVGASQQFIATGNYSNATTNNINTTVIWLSSATGVASVSSTGQVVAIAPGVTNISATQGALTTTTTFTVTAAPIAGINLGGATSFAVLAGTSITNNAGGTTLVSGDIGSSSQIVDPVQAAGFINYKSGAILNTALADLQVAIADANSRTCTSSSASGIDLGGQTFTPGVYCYAGAINITGTFTMNGAGLYLFRSSSTLNTTANSIVALTGGATASSVFWVPVAATTLGANSVFKGSIMAQSAGITLGDTTTLQNGRVLSGSAVTLKNNVIAR